MINDFSKDNARVDGIYPKCKECYKVYNDSNVINISSNNKKYYKENKEKIKTQKNHYMNSFAKYSVFFDKLTDDESPISYNGGLLVLCYKCKKYFLPKNREVLNRINALSTNTGFEGHLYCSDNCKKTCDVFRQINKRKSENSLLKKSRCNQSLNKKSLIGIQKDNYGYSFCEKCGEETNKLVIHHNIMVSKDISMADDMSHQILVCNKCHNHINC